MGAEEVLVVPASALSLPRFSVDPADVASVLSAVERLGCFRLRKPDAEGDPSTRQVIPYVVVVAEPSGLVFGTLRIAGGEPRLLGRISLGIGGHINPVDGAGSPLDALSAGLAREWGEEVACSAPPVFGDPVAVVNDESDLVGRVHLGLVYVVRIGDADTVSVRETGILEGRWLSRADLREQADRLEGWGAIVAAGLFGGPAD